MALRNWNPPRVEGPVPHKSAGQILASQRYVVGWPNGIVKIGSTWSGRRRWGAFLNRGAVIIDLAFYEHLNEGLEAEVWLQRQAAVRYPRAFTDRGEAADYLGGNGSGWAECFTVPAAEWPDLARLAGAEL